MSLNALKHEAFNNEAVRAEYDNLADEFELIDQLTSMRSKAGLTQEELASASEPQKVIFPDWSEAAATLVGRR